MENGDDGPESTASGIDENDGDGDTLESGGLQDGTTRVDHAGQESPAHRGSTQTRQFEKDDGLGRVHLGVGFDEA